MPSKKVPASKRSSGGYADRVPRGSERTCSFTRVKCGGGYRVMPKHRSTGNY